MLRWMVVVLLALSEAPALFCADFWLANFDARRLRGVSLCATAPTNGQVLTYSSSSGSWCAAAASAGVSLSGTTGQFAYQSGSGTLATDAFLVSSTTARTYTPKGPIFLTNSSGGTAGCGFYTATTGSAPVRDRFLFDCASSGQFTTVSWIDSGGNAAEFISSGSGWTASGLSAVTLTQTSLGTTPSAGLSVENTTAAAAGAQQVSGPTRWTGRGWKTNATASSQTVTFQAYVLPVQGAANPSGLWKVQSSINGGAYADRFTVNSLGAAIVAPASSDPGCAAGTLGSIWFDSSTASDTVMKVCLNVASTPTWVTK